MTLENRHRAVTLVSVACSGAETSRACSSITMRASARARRAARKVPPQLDQVADLICRGGAQGRTQAASYTLPIYKHGSTGISAQTVSKQWCPPANRKRPIDLVLLSIGGNDVGFGALALYASTESARDLAPIAGLVGSEIRFGPEVSRAYLGALDKRIKAVRDALVDGFGVEPARVLQNAYEPIQFDETGSYCGNAGDARHGRASLAQGEQGAAERGRRTSRPSCRSGSPAWPRPRAGATARPDLRPAAAPASASSPSTRRSSPSAASARAIRPARWSIRPR